MWRAMEVSYGVSTVCVDHCAKSHPFNARV